MFDSKAFPDTSPSVQPSDSRNTPEWNFFPECPIPYEDGELLLSSSQSEGKNTHVYVYRLFQDTVPRPVFGEYDAIVLHLHNAVTLERRYDGVWKSGLSSPGGLCINPKSAATTYKWTGSPVCAAIAIAPSIFTTLTDEIGNRDPSLVEIIGNFNFNDPAIEHICRNLVDEVKTAELGGPIFTELMGQALGILLLRKHSTLSVIRDLPLQKLTQTQISCIDAYIDAHLEKSMTLRELAASIGLSPSYFSKLFKYTMGIPPHQYVIKWRVEQAQHLLREGKMTIAEVAAKVGFTDQSHLTHHFKHLLGITPRALLVESKYLQKPD